MPVICCRLSILALLLAATAARAEEVWLITDSDEVEGGRPVWVSLAAGDVFPMAEKALAPTAFGEIVEQCAGRTTSLGALSRQDSNWSVRRPLGAPGMHVLGCELVPQPDNAGQTLYFAKTLVQVGPTVSGDQGFAKPFSHTLEIVPRSNPMRWRPGETTAVQVLLEGHPWVGVAVSAGHEGLENASTALSTTTDAQGMARITFSRPGHWYVAAELKRPIGGIGRPGTQTLRATLTFRVHGDDELIPQLAAIRAIHGGLDLAALVGYRIGLRALAELGLQPGSADLVAVQWSPTDSPLVGMIDGVQAATRASPGRQNLKLEETPSAADAQMVFTDRASRRRLVCRLRTETAQRIRESQSKEDDALQAAVRRDEELFDVTLIGPTAPPDKTPSPTVATAVIANVGPRS